MVNGKAAVYGVVLVMALLIAVMVQAQPGPPPGVGNDTNAETECPDGHALLGDGSCVDVVALQQQLDNLTAHASGVKIGFVTSTQHDGNLGGIAGADEICNALAAAAGLTGNYRAWLGVTSATAPNQRFFQNPDTYKMTDNVRLANDYADLTDGAILNKLQKDENNATQIDRIWSNVGADGEVVGSTSRDHCIQWTSAAGSRFGNLGINTRSDGQWTNESQKL